MISVASTIRFMPHVELAGVLVGDLEAEPLIKSHRGIDFRDTECYGQVAGLCY